MAYTKMAAIDAATNSFPPEVRAALVASTEFTNAVAALEGPAWALWRNVPATQNLNTFRVPGVHRIVSADTATITNLPSGMTGACMFENLKTGDGGANDVWWVQRITQHGTPRFWWRSTSDLIGGWNAWQEVKDWNPAGRNVPSGQDLNTYRTPGLSRIRTPDTATITNLPPGMRTSGVLQNLSNGDGTDSIMAQIITENGNYARVWWRSFMDDGTFGLWSRQDENNSPVTEWHVMLAIGQSNMSGRGIVTTAIGGRYMSSRIAQYGSTRRVLETATVPLDMHDSASGLSPATTAAQAYLKNKPSHIGVLIVPAAHGATGFTTSTSSYTWTPNAATVPIYDLPALAVAQTQEAIAAAKATGATAVLTAILWHQGENNSTMSTATYASNLDALIAYLRAQLSEPTVPFLVGQMNPEGIAANAGRSNIDAAHQQTPSRVMYTGFAPATTGAYNPGDTTHMSRANVDFLGNSYIVALAMARFNSAQATSQIAPIVAAYIASDPTVVQAAVAMASSSAGVLQAWKPNTAYASGVQVYAPTTGDIITKNGNGTTGATFSMTGWTASANTIAITTKMDSSQKGAVSGVASLDAQGKVPVSQGSVNLPTDQLDYVAALVARSKSTKLQLKKNTSTNEVEVSCLTPSGNHITYQFYGSTAGDDYRVLANIWAGTSTATTGQTDRKAWSDITTTGTYSAVASAFIYTTDKATPATFTTSINVDVAGSALRFHTYKDNRGGVWQLTISGAQMDMMQSVSTWQSAAGAYDTTGVVIFNNLSPGTYTITGTFLGDDPANAPTGGTSRGWLANNAAGTGNPTTFSVWAPFRAVNKDILLKPASNMDFAMEVKPSGGPTLEFMPYHGVATMFQADAPVYLDGDVVVDVPNMAVGQYRALNGFELVQRVYGRNSSSGATNLVEVATSHIVRPHGQVTVSGKWKALVNIDLGNNYHMMFPANMALFDKLVTSMGNAYRNGADLIGQETNLVAENDTAMSYMLLSSTNKSIAGAVRFTNPSETIRRGKANKNPDSTKTFMQHRDASIVKIYSRAYATGTAIAAGTTNRFSGDYIYAQGLGLYDQYAV